MSDNSLQALSELGQSLWYDNIERTLLSNGDLARLVAEDYVVGLTSNPSIFQKSIGGSEAYDPQIEAVLSENPTISIKALYEALAIEDIQQAAEILQPIYERTHGGDGYVSLEVSPDLAHDTDGTIAEAKRLFETVGRPNVMIKIPATSAGLPAITDVIGVGINVNVTLMFSLQDYIDVANAYIAGLEKLDAAGGDVSQVASVASFFVSRVDTVLDKLLAENGSAEAEALQGKLAIANAKVAYLEFKKMFGSDRFQKLAAKGAKVQRPLWASTGTKNPSYSDVLYIEELIGPDTVNTAPPATIDKFKDHGQAKPSLETELEQAPILMAQMKALGIDYDGATQTLQDDGVSAFAEAFTQLLQTLEAKQEAILSKQVSPMSLNLGGYQNPVEVRLKAWNAADVQRRIWEQDGTVWVADPQKAAETPELTNRLGWLTIGETMVAQAEELTNFAQAIKAADFNAVVLLGMGGSSLAPEVFMTVFGADNGLPLTVLDSTNPDQVLAVSNTLADVARTLFIVSSKSGGTLETLSFYKYFYELVGQQKDNPGENFVAITDPGSKLEALANEKGFRRIFASPPDVGGRYSALTYFGLVPAALVGVDVQKLLRRANSMATACRSHVTHNPGLQLGAIMGELALAGRDKMTFFASPSIEPLGMWIEQLVAESMGKHGVGILPVVGETIAEPAIYNNDRLFVFLRMADDDNVKLDGMLDVLEAAGHPTIIIEMNELEDCGQEFFRWEMATAAAGAVLKINPFDQPDVESAKIAAKALMAEFDKTGALPVEAAALTDGNLQLYGPAMGETAADALNAFMGQAKTGDYVAIMAYLPDTPEIEAALQSLRLSLRNKLQVATTIGFGPRFLHSTGQLHKGDGNRGLFIQITHTPTNHVNIPGESYDFNTVVAAQAQGDYNALAENNRRLIRFHIEQGDLAETICRLIPN